MSLGPPRRMKMTSRCPATTKKYRLLDRLFGEQYGPTRASRAMAIVHIAICEVVNAITGGYQSYTGLPPSRPIPPFSPSVPRMARTILNRVSASSSSRVTSPGSGARTPSASSDSRWALTGLGSHRSSWHQATSSGRRPARSRP